MTGKTVNEILQTVVDRSDAQKAMRIEKMRDELVGMGYSVVTTEWLNEVFRDMPFASLRKGAAE